MPGAVCYEVVIILVENQRHRLHNVVMAIAAIYTFAIFVDVEVSEDDLPVGVDRFLYSIYIIINALVPMFPGVEVDDVVLEDGHPVAAAEVCNFVNELGCLLFGDEAGRLNGVYQYLELRHAKAAVGNVIGTFVVYQQGHDLVSLLVEQLHIQMQGTTIALNIHR